MRRFLISTCLIALASLVLAGPAHSHHTEGFVETVISRPDGGDWQEVVGLTFDESGRMFAWERGGRIWIVDDANPVTTPFIDIGPEVGAWQDHGLLGVALDPDFKDNGYIYLLYIVDRHHLFNCDEHPSGVGPPVCAIDYDPLVNEYNDATIGRLTRYTAVMPSGASDFSGAVSTNPATRKVLIGKTIESGLPSTATSHGVGSVIFGTDGTLLLLMGDGAHAIEDVGGDNNRYTLQALADGILLPEHDVGAYRAQMIDSLNGKIHRVDPATGNGIPSNPFFDSADPASPRSRVWTLGIRNAFRMTLQPGTGSHDPSAGDPGTILAADVGWRGWDEFNRIEGPGQNLGWPLFEGLEPISFFGTPGIANPLAPNPLFGIDGCTQEFFRFEDLIRQDSMNLPLSFPNPCDATQEISSVPVFMHLRPELDWGHDTGPARTGIYVGGEAATIDIHRAASPVSGNSFAGATSIGGVWYSGDDFPSEYRNSYFHGDFTGGWIKNFRFDDDGNLAQVVDFSDEVLGVVAFATSPVTGGLYFVEWTTTVKRLDYAPGGNFLPQAVARPPQSHSANSTHTVNFDGASSNDADGTISSWHWDFGDGTTSTAVSPSHSFSTTESGPKTFDVELTVTDNTGAQGHDIAIVALNNTPPSVAILSPVDGTSYPPGTSGITYDLLADFSDAEHARGELSCEWRVALAHNSHLHSNPPIQECNSSFVLEPLGCGGVFYQWEVELTVTDGAGLSTTDYATLLPYCAGGNVPPTANGDMAGVDVGGTVEIDVLANDYDDAGVVPSSVRVVTGPGVGNVEAVDSLTGKITYKHDGSANHFTTLAYDFQDTNGARSNAATVAIYVGINPFNLVPVVEAGSDQFIEAGSSANVLGSVSDDGLPSPPSLLTYQWVHTGGSGTGSVLFSASTALATSVDISQAGTYELTLFASDGELTGSDSLSITAKVNERPVVDAGPDFEVAAEAPINISGSATDDGLPNPPDSLGYLWTKTSGDGIATFGDPNVAETLVSFDTPGAYELTLAVSDGALTGTDTVQVLVGEPSPYELVSIAAAQDTWLSSSVPAANYGDQLKMLVNNSPDRFGLAQFDLTSLAGLGVQMAKLRVYAASLNSPGPVDIRAALSSWTDSAVTYGTAPALDSSVAATLTFVADDAGEYVEVDVTALVQAWVAGALPNYGLAVVAGGSITAKLGSIESGFPMFLDVTTGPAGNQAPNVNAGSDVLVENGATISLAGVVTDDGLPDPPMLTYQWARTGGSGGGTVSFTSATSLATDVSASQDGEYELTLSANDTEMTGMDTVLLTVATNRAPIVNAGVDDTVPLSSGATVVGSATDDGLPISPGSLTYTWSKTSGDGAVSFANSNAPSTTVGFDSAGIYELTLTVTDGDLSGSDSVVFTVDPNEAPVVDAGPNLVGNIGEAIDILGSATDDGMPDPPGALTYMWAKTGGDGAASFGDASSAITTVTFDTPGLYELTLAADDGTRTGADVVEINVADPDGSLMVELPATADTWLNGSSPATNFGSQLKIIVDNSPDRLGLGAFDLSGIAGLNVQSARLHIYPVYLATPGQVHVRAVTEPWAESAVSYGTAPALDGAVQGSFTLGTTGAYVSVDVTALVQAWQTGGLANHGLALVQGGVVTAKLGTIESGQPMKLEVTTGPAGPAVNQRPIVNAGENLFVASGSSGSLLGVVSDDGLPDPPSLTYEWSHTGGSGAGTVTFTSSSALVSDVSATQDGEYELTLSASDTELTGTDTLLLTVQTNQAPVVDAGADDTVSLTGVATLAGSATDDGLPASPGSLSYTWSKSGGAGAVSFGNPNAATTTVSFDAAGVYELTLTVSDGELPSQDVVEITVNEPGSGETSTLQAVADTWLNGSSPGTNYGAQQKMLVDNSPHRIGLAQFDLSSLGGAEVQTATLRFYPSFLNTPGPIDVRAVTGAWTALDATYSTMPSLDSAVAATVNVATAGSYVNVDVTSMVQAWQSGGLANNGLALVPGGTVTAKLGTIENRFPMELEVTTGSAGNQRPVVNAGADQAVLPGESATLAGSATDDGMPEPASLTYHWTQTGGPGAATFVDDLSATTDVSFDTDGAYDLTLSVNDGALIGTDVVRIVVGAGGSTSETTVLPWQDTWVNSTAQNVNMGGQAKMLVDNAPHRLGYGQFDLTQLGGLTVQNATLRIYVAYLGTPGPVDVKAATSAWDGSQLTYATQPSLAVDAAGSASLPAGSAGQFIDINITALVQAWIDGSLANNGLALVPGGTVTVKLGSLESGAPMELEVTTMN